MPETTADSLRGLCRRLSDAGVPSAQADAIRLLAHVRGVDLSTARTLDLLNRPLTSAQRDRLADLVQARTERVPLQHLIGRAPFRRLDLAVGPGVFTPRPETELAVDLAVVALPAGGRLVDLCTGSGAIALAVADERPDAKVHAVELDPMAHAWAQRNVATLAPEVDLRCGDATSAFDDLLGRADVVVSNPPYIPVGMVPLEPEVRDHDPQVALYGGSEDGLSIPLAVAARAAELLCPEGVLVMEHADSQGESLPARLRAAGWSQVRDHLDLNGRPRATTAVRPG